MSLREVNRILAEFAKQKLDPKSAAATRWLATNMSKIQSQMRPDTYNRIRPTTSGPLSMNVGCVIFFGYSPIGKDRLPFWDEYPLVVLLKKRGNSLLGLNLHYLKPVERAVFLNHLLKTVDNPNYHRDPPSYINTTYGQLKNNKLLKKCIKRYLISKIKTKINIIPSDEWKIVTFLPIDRFKGATRNEVWSKGTK